MEEPLNQETNPYGLYEDYDDLCAELSSLPVDAKVPSGLTKQIQEWAVAYILAWGMERLPEDLDKQKYGQLPGVDETDKNDQRDEMVSSAMNAWMRKDYQPMASLINEVKAGYEKGTTEERIWDLAAKSLEMKNTIDNRS